MPLVKQCQICLSSGGIIFVALLAALSLRMASAMPSLSERRMSELATSYVKMGEYVDQVRRMQKYSGTVVRAPE